MEEIIAAAQQWCLYHNIDPNRMKELDLRQCIDDVTRSLNLQKWEVEYLLRGYFS